MDPFKAGSLFGHGLLKSVCEADSFKLAKLDFEAIRQKIKAGGISRPGGAGSGDTLLHAFSNNGNHEAVDFLLPLGARVEARTKVGHQTALDLAVTNNHEKVIDLLLKSGAIVELEDTTTTALYKAATRGFIGPLRLLLQHTKPPASWNMPTLLYQTALQGHQNALQLLLEYGAKDIRPVQADYSPYFKTQSTNRSPRRRSALHEAITQGFNEGVIEMLITGDNVLAVDTTDRTALHEATKLSGVHVVEMLIKGKADVSAISSDGMTPLHIAILRADSEAVKITKVLLENTATVDSIDNERQTPLDLAIFTSEILCPEIIQLLLEHHASITATDRLATKALQKMIFTATPEATVVVNLLLNRNASIDPLWGLSYSEEMYAGLVGEETARRILTRLSGAKRRNTQASSTGAGRQGSLWRRPRKAARNTTMCKLSRSFCTDSRIQEFVKEAWAICNPA
jgi:ankyrin repeat protein